MSANEEMELVAKILQTGELQPVITAGITLDDFHSPEGVPAFKYIYNYWHARGTNGEVPTRDQFERHYPTIQLPDEDRLSLDAAIKEFRNYAINAKLAELSSFMLDYPEDPDKVIRAVQAEIHEMARTRRIDIDIVLADAVQTAVADYNIRKDMVGYQGVPFPWETLNEETQGMIDGQYLVIYGRPKSMKTWVLLHCACTAYHYHNRRVLIYTREMTPTQMRDRCICLLLQVPYSAYRKGKLHELPCPSGRGTMEDRFFELVEIMGDEEHICRTESGYKKGLIITSDRDDPRGGGVSGLRQKIKDHEPDLICVDGQYLMRNDRSNTRSVKWEDQYAISQDLKDVALDFNRPLLATTQATRGSRENMNEGTDDIAFADAVGMDCDLAMKVIKKRTQDPEVNELALLFKASREMNMFGFAINGCAATDFGQLLMKAKTDDGMLLTDDHGNPFYAPVIFHSPADAKAMFKEQEAKDKKERRPAEVMSKLAGHFLTSGQRQGRSKR